MDVPQCLDAWTYDTVLTVVMKHDSEPGWFDFKESLHPTKGTDKWKADHLASIRRTTCSMANGDGGYLLFGVQDPNVSVATPKDRIVGIPYTTNLRKEVGDKLKPVQRKIFFDTNALRLPDDHTQCVLVVHVPTSPLRPHMDVNEGIFYIRGEGGAAKPMNFFEVRDQMLYTEGRLQKVTLLRLELVTFKDVCQMLMDPSTWSVRFDASAFKVLLADICDLLQPDSSLLGLLHGIGSDAVALNYLLDREKEIRLDRQKEVRSQQSTMIGGINEKNVVTQQVTDRRAHLSNNCVQAQERLAELFGPLKIL